MDSKPYHSRIFRVYLEFLEKECGWSRSRQDEFLKSIDISRERIYDEAAWFDLKFADLFFEAAVKESGRPNIAYEAGLFVHAQNYSPVTHVLFSSFLAIETLYKLSGSIAKHFSKAATMKVLKSRFQYVLLESRPTLGHIERPYMCENRRGMLAGLPSVFGLEYAEVHELECLHHGGQRCLYEIRWQDRAKLGRNIAWASSIASLSIGAYIFFGAAGSIISALTAGSILVLLKARAVMSNQRDRLLQQNETLHQGLLDVEYRARQMELLSRVTRLAHSSPSPKVLGETLVRSICELLGYDRAMMLTVDFEHSILHLNSHHGFSREFGELLAQAEFNIRPDNTTGFFVAVVNSKQPLFIKDVVGNLEKLSKRSRKFAELLGSKSFIAVPIFDKDRGVQGVLAVDNITPGKALTISDQDLLMTLSENVGISLEQAALIDQLANNLETTRRIASQQANLRSTFEKFVPTQVARRLTEISEEGNLDAQMLKTANKKEIAVMFCDIFAFTETASKLQPEDVIDYLNTIFEKLTPHITIYHGFIDKFTGDGFMAVFEGPESSVKACAAALEIIEEVETINRNLTEKRYPAMNLGLGINRGPAILGNIGSPERMNFTVIGEVVNLASRLEGYTRQIGPNSICCSSSVMHQTKDLYQWKDLGEISLKGYQEQIHAYQLLSIVSAPSAQSSELPAPDAKK